MAKQPRSPIIAVLGHVDHGKTSLLDYIRQTKVQAKEAGGITQNIGAYQAEHEGKLITFIDTPGHAAFKEMRSRGAAVTDIVVLVVAADDGVKPQTIESIQHIKQAKVPVVVAINKMDVQGASAEMVKAQLTEQEIFTVGYGGDVEAIEVSAKTGQGVDKLLETLVTFGEVLELLADPQASLKGVVIESEKDKFLGPVATVLVQEGTLHLKDKIWAGNTDGQIRTMLDANGNRLKEASPAQPALVTGFSDVPAIGSLVLDHEVEAEVSPKQNEVDLSSLLAAIEDEPKLPLVIKASSIGTLEAVTSNLPAENITIVGSGVGDVNESDVMLAQTSGAMVVAFQVGIPGAIKKVAQNEAVEIKSYRIIYKLLEDVQEKILRLLEPTIAETKLATAEVLQIFEIRGEKIYGCQVKDGVLRRGQNIHLKRQDKVVADTTITSLKEGKTDVDSVEVGKECGVMLAKLLDGQAGDIIEAYTAEDK